MSKMALLFPGQGAQFVGMGRPLCEAFPEALEVFDRADRILGLDLKQTCFEGPESKLTDTSWCQPAIFTHSWAALTVLRARFDPLPMDACAGLSLGEFTALCASGMLSFEDGLKTVHRRGALMQEACELSKGAMASILGAETGLLREICGESDAQIANINAPGQVVLSGSAEAIERALALARERGVRRSILLKVAGAYHSRLMQPAAEALATWLGPVPLQEQTVPVISNVTALPHEAGSVKDRLVEQVTGTVRWEESMRHLLASGIRLFIEMGPGEVLASLMKRIEPAARVVSFGKPEDLDKVKSFLETAVAAGTPLD